jgi:hypothetical protein
MVDSDVEKTKACAGYAEPSDGRIGLKLGNVALSAHHVIPRRASRVHESLRA